MTRPTVLELFAGIGGLSLGLERAGFHVVGQVEINPFARSILTKHWPEVPKHDDVKTALDWWLSEPRPRVDCVAGGYPCQPESNAGKRLSTADERWLWPEFARIVHAVQPRWVIGENVSGHRTRGLRFVLRDLADLGYTARAGTLSAGEMGAPHKRNRIFVIAERDLSDADREQLRQQPGRSGGPDGQGAPLAGVDGPARPVADAHGLDGRAGRSGGPALQGDPGTAEPQAGLAHAHGAVGRPEAGDAVTGARGTTVRAGAPESGRRGGDVANAHGEGLDPGSGMGPTGQTALRTGGWPAEPRLDRVANGVPDQVDRLRALGNAVVPAVAEHIGHLVLSGAWRDV